VPSVNEVTGILSAVEAGDPHVAAGLLPRFFDSFIPGWAPET